MFSCRSCDRCSDLAGYPIFYWITALQTFLVWRRSFLMPTTVISDPAAVDMYSFLTILILALCSTILFLTCLYLLHCSDFAVLIVVQVRYCKWIAFLSIGGIKRRNLTMMTFSWLVPFLLDEEAEQEEISWLVARSAQCAKRHPGRAPETLLGLLRAPACVQQ